MRLEPLYRIRFVYEEDWMVGLEEGWEQHLFFAEGRCEGSITGRFRGANFPVGGDRAAPTRPTSAPRSRPMTEPRSWLSCTDTGGHTRLAGVRSSAPCYTSATATGIVG